MGLDLVELVLQTEEAFSVDLPDDECGRIQTVGDLYRLVLSKLNLPYIAATQISIPGRDRSRLKLASIKTWTPEDVWATLKALITNQLQIEDDEVRESVHFRNDLGCD